MKKIFAVIILSLGLISTVQAEGFNSKEDCRIRVSTSFSMSNFGEFDSMLYSMELTKFLSDKLNYEISFEKDSRYSLNITLTGDGNSKTLTHSMILTSIDSSMSIKQNGSESGIGRKTKKQTKKIEEILRELQSNIPHSPCYH